MKTITTAALLAIFISPIAAESVNAGPISRACMSSPRKQKSASLCHCIQKVANQTLDGADQRRGAKYLRKPEKLQEVRQSDLRSNEVFWKRWKAFGQAASQACR